MATSTERPPLTDRQKKALAALRNNPGDANAVAEALGISASGAHSHIQALKKKHYIDDKLTPIASKAVISDVPDISGDADEAPVAATNGIHPSFDLDAKVDAVVKEQIESLKRAVENIEATISVHEQRQLEIQNEAEAHHRAVESLSHQREALGASLAALRD